MHRLFSNNTTGVPTALEKREKETLKGRIWTRFLGPGRWMWTESGIARGKSAAAEIILSVRYKSSAKTVPRASLLYLALSLGNLGGKSDYPCVIDGETEAQRSLQPGLQNSRAGLGQSWKRSPPPEKSICSHKEYVRTWPHSPLCMSSTATFLR